MRSLHLLLVTGSFLFMACGNGQGPHVEASSAPARSEVVEAITHGEPVTMADLEITGMSCAMMCGGSIKKALAAIDGVVKTDIQFNEGEEADHAVVTFDPERVNDAKLVEAVQGLYDGQYKVVAVRVTKQVKKPAEAGDQREETTSSRDGQVSVSLSGLLLPGLYMVLSQVLRS